MKGNEARVVFYLHPVDKLKEGQVAKVKPLRNSFLVGFLGLLIGLAPLFYVFYVQFGVQTRSRQRSVSTTDISSDTSTETAAVRERSREVTNNRERGNLCSAETQATTLPGMITLCYKSH